MSDVGRPTVMTPEILNKLEEVFALGGTDAEACLYANIGESTLYSYQKDHPEFVERKAQLKETPILKARRTVVESLEDPNHAFRFLERKRKKEFGASVDVTSDGQPLSINLVRYGDDNAPVSVQPEGVSTPLPESDGQRLQAGGEGVESTIG